MTLSTDNKLSTVDHTFEIFDSHLHIIDKRFPLVENNGYIPEEFTCNDYLNKVSGFNLIGGAIVSGSFQAYDRDYILSALKTLGKNYVGVIHLPNTATDNEIVKLDKAGIRGIRFNLYRRGPDSIKYLNYLANRVYDLVGWHVELYLDSESLPDLSNQLLQLPTVSIDHLGLKKSGFKFLLELVEKDVKVKATGFGRIDFDPRQAIKDIYHANTESLMFGTDLPSTRSPVAFQGSDVFIITETLGPDAAEKVFSNNAINFYRIKDS